MLYGLRRAFVPKALRECAGSPPHYLASFFKKKNLSGYGNNFCHQLPAIGSCMVGPRDGVWEETEGTEPLWHVRFACCSSVALPTISVATVYVALNMTLQGFKFHWFFPVLIRRAAEKLKALQISQLLTPIWLSYCCVHHLLSSPVWGWIWVSLSFPGKWSSQTLSVSPLVGGI